MKYVIVGGVAGGASAAARLRRLDEHAEIIVLERGSYVSFANCGLPYHIGGKIPERESLLVQSVEGLCSSFQMDIRIRHEALSIDREGKRVIIRELDSGKEYQETYDALLLSPGAQPQSPPIPGISSPRIASLRTMEDMDRIIRMLDDYQAGEAAVVGAGFIGLEIAENLMERGIKVTLIEKTDQVLPPVDYDIASQLRQHLENQGVKLVLNSGVAEFSEQSGGLRLRLENRKELHADVAVLSLGVKPETRLAETAGLALGTCGGIQVDEFLRTSDESIYAVGDAAAVKHWVHGKQTLIPLAWPANRQGRLAADSMTGRRKQGYGGTMGASIVQVFGKTAASTGLNEKTLRSLGIAYQAVTVTREDHAGYYPDAQEIKLKVLFSPAGEIFGAQAVGASGVDKRIDLISAAMKGSLHVQQLQDLEVAYAPPYNSAKDPVNIAGYAAENLLEGLVSSVRYDEVEGLLEDGNTIPLDVRTPEEHEAGALPGSLLISLDELRGRLDELDREKTYLVYCEVGYRGYIASRILQQHGYRVYNLDGGYSLWHPACLR